MRTKITVLSNASSTYCHGDVLYFDQLVGQIIKKTALGKEIITRAKAPSAIVFATNKHSSETLTKNKQVF